jgi:hypothetical protein
MEPTTGGRRILLATERKLQQEEAREQDFYWPMHFHQRAPETNLHLMEDRDEVEPDKADLESITSIQDSCSQPKITPALHHHERGISFHGKSFLENASL